jgi:hypothetical protein
MRHRSTPPHLEYYRSRTACPLHGTMNKLASSGQCVTCGALADWRRRHAQADSRAAVEAVAVAADRMQSILKRPQPPTGAKSQQEAP